MTGRLYDGFVRNILNPLDPILAVLLSIVSLKVANPGINVNSSAN